VFSGRSKSYLLALWRFSEAFQNTETEYFFVSLAKSYGKQQTKNEWLLEVVIDVQQNNCIQRQRKHVQMTFADNKCNQCIFLVTANSPFSTRAA